MDDLRFITVSSNPDLTQKDGRYRHLIRSAATRATRSRKARELSDQHHTQSDQIREKSQRGQMTKFRAKLNGNVIATNQDVLTRSSTALNLENRVSIWDPIVTPLGGQSWALLHYYRYLFRASSWAINAKRDWFAFIIGDQSATHATLAFVSLNRDLEEGTTISVPTLHHRNQALRLVRQRLSAARSPVEDCTIGAVALLAITEGLEGHSSSSAIHVQALKRLVDSRGGLEHLCRNDALTGLVHWAELCHTSTFLSRSNLPRQLQSFRLEDHIDDKSSDFQIAVRMTMSPRMYDLVKLLDKIPKYAPTDETSSDERQYTSHLIYHLNQLAWSIYHGGLGSGDDISGQVAKVLWYSICLYISLVLRQMPRLTMVVRERAQKLYASLGQMQRDFSLNSAQGEPYLHVTLWAYTLYFCFLSPPERGEMIKSNLDWILGDLQIKNVEDFKHHLGQIHWLDGYASDTLKILLTS